MPAARLPVDAPAALWAATSPAVAAMATNLMDGHGGVENVAGAPGDEPGDQRRHDGGDAVGVVGDEPQHAFEHLERLEERRQQVDGGGDAGHQGVREDHADVLDDPPDGFQPPHDRLEAGSERLVHGLAQPGRAAGHQRLPCRLELGSEAP